MQGPLRPPPSPAEEAPQADEGSFDLTQELERQLDKEEAQKLAQVQPILGGRSKREGLGVSKEAAHWPGPSSYEGNVDSLYERMV